jgi:hypothetical protein
MKQLLILSLLIFLFSCKKEENLRWQFAGKWEFENFSGYTFNNNYQPPGNGNIIVLTEEGQFERRKFDSISFRGNYSIQKKKDCLQRETDLLFTSTENNYSERYITVENGKLTLSTPNCYQDGGTAYYRRLD